MNRLRLLGKMAEADISQVELAKKIGITENTFSAKINGKSPFDILQVEKMCEILNIKSSDDKVDIFLSSATR